MYAHNPKKYAGYEKSKEVFRQLRKNNKLTDSPAQVYWRNPDTSWNTLIDKSSEELEADSPKKNIPLDNYFDDEAKPEIPKYNFYQVMMSISSLIFFGSLIGIIMLIILNFSNSSKFPAFTYEKAKLKEIPFYFAYSSTYTDTIRPVLTIDTTNKILERDTPSVIPLSIDSTKKSISIKYAGNVIFDTLMKIQYSSYSILLTRQ